MRKLMAFVILMLCFRGGPVFAANYEIKKVAENIYAALAIPRGKAISNALIVVTESGAILAGSHFTAEGVEDLVAEIGKLTPVPLKYVVLTHHHRGYNHIDFDFPPNVDVITSLQVWQVLQSESRQFKNPVVFFDTSLSLKKGKLNIILSNMGSGQSESDVIVYIPEESVLFTSDLVFNGMVGYMGDGYVREWVLNLENLLALQAFIVVPGMGKVTDSAGIEQFMVFLKEFLTEVFQHVEKGKSLAQTKKDFKLPAYESLPGFRTFLDINVDRAYRQLKEEFKR